MDELIFKTDNMHLSMRDEFSFHADLFKVKMSAGYQL